MNERLEEEVLVVGKVTFEVDDDNYCDSSASSDFSPSRCVTDRSSSSLEESVSNEVYKEIELDRTTRRSSTSAIPNKSKRPSLLDVQKASVSYNKSRSTSRLNSSLPLNYNKPKEFPKREFSIENCTSEDFMKDELISKYLFETKTDEKKYPQTASWRESQQKKKHMIKCYVFFCFVFTVCMFLIYGYYENPFREEAQQDAHQGVFIDTNNNDSNEAEQDVLIDINKDSNYYVSLGDIMPGIQQMTSEDDLQDSTSPQSKALVWLKTKDVKVASTSLETYLQRYILATFFYATTLSSNNWMSHEDECNWYGIECDSHSMLETGQITALTLTGLNLEGSIPSEVGFLKSLKSLDLSNNLLTTIDDNLQLTNLETLDVSNNQLDKLPDLDAFHSLKTLKMSNNDLKGSIPASIGNLPLVELYLNKNTFSGNFPFLNLQNTPIQTIVVDDNLLQGEIPDSLDMPDLETLSLGHNLFFGTLPTFSNSIQVLNLNHNDFEGTLPQSHFSNLRELRIEGNLLQGDFTEYCSLNTLQVFSSDCDSKQNITCNCCTSCF